jgi:DNA-binding NtrC family response regulator
MLAQIPATIPTPPPVVALPAARDFAPRQGKRALQALVVDDEPLVRWAIAETLRFAGYEIQEAGDADGAVRALLERATEPDLVLLDLRLPDCVDLSLLETVLLVAPEATVVLMTAFGTPEVRDSALRLGAACVLDKPFDVEGLDVLMSGLRERR